MIELACYNGLSLKEKADIMRFKGVYLCSRQEPEFLIDLYQIDNFYVEAYYHIRRKEIINIYSFSSTDPLQTYFSEIELEKLIGELLIQA